MKIDVVPAILVLLLAVRRRPELPRPPFRRRSHFRRTHGGPPENGRVADPPPLAPSMFTPASEPIGSVSSVEPSPPRSTTHVRPARLP